MLLKMEMTFLKSKNSKNKAELGRKKQERP
jgi:hypothetical protein